MCTNCREAYTSQGKNTLSRCFTPSHDFLQFIGRLGRLARMLYLIGLNPRGAVPTISVSYYNQMKGETLA